MLEGDAQNRVHKGGVIKAYGNIQDIALTYEFLIDSLEDQKVVVDDYLDPKHFKININLSQAKLNDYYTKLNETLAYYASTILNPISYQSYFKNTQTDEVQLAWLQEAKRLVRGLWESEYKTLPIPNTPKEEPPYKWLKTISVLERHYI